MVFWQDAEGSGHAAKAERKIYTTRRINHVRKPAGCEELGGYTMATEIRNERELEFIFFCIENTAKKLGVPAERLYDALKKSGLLLDYLVANYEALHTQGKDYIVNDLIDTMKDAGVQL